MIIVEDLVHKYKSSQGEIVTALDHLNLRINEGEFVVVIGHNGSGKSTLAKHLNVLLHPTSGTVSIDNIDTRDNEKLWSIRQKVGMVFQNPDNQLVATTVEEDVAFGPENLGIHPEEIRQRIDEALKQVGMYDYKTHAPHLLSGGQKQRVAIAGIVAMRPKILVLDEPTAMLDPVGRAEVMKTIYNLNKEEDLTVVHITHFMEEAVLADRVIVMDSGKVIMEGKPRDIFVKVDELKRLRLDVPPMTELANQLIYDDIPISQDILTIEEMVEALCQLR